MRLNFCVEFEMIKKLLSDPKPNLLYVLYSEFFQRSVLKIVLA